LERLCKALAFLNDRWEVSMSNFHYVYLLIDVATETHHYTGCTENLQDRLGKHNTGDVPHTAKYRPWKIQTAIAFDTKEKAFAFEAYLKSHSGRAFATKHF
jgi:predicted GIY-YIG superfamily endonuclease